MSNIFAPRAAIVLATTMTMLVLATPKQSKADWVRIELKTGRDDLRDNCYAHIYLKLKGQPMKRIYTFRGGLPSNSYRQKWVKVPELTNPRDVEGFQVWHISNQSFPQTEDNWDMQSIRIYHFRDGRYSTIANYGFHRFTGRSRWLR